MPTQKDLKRLVRSRMKKTGEAYTAARLQLVKNERSRVLMWAVIKSEIDNFFFCGNVPYV